MILRSTLTATLVILCCALWARPIQAGVVIVKGTIAGDTTWSNADTIVVAGAVDVAATGWLTIQAGAVVLFAPATGLTVFGLLTANGEANDRIVFTSSADTAGGSPVAGSWSGLSF